METSLRGALEGIAQANGLNDIQTTKLRIDVDQFIDEWFREHESGEQ
jgi:hypothetical protein